MNKAEEELERRNKYSRDATNAANKRKREAGFTPKTIWVHSSDELMFKVFKETLLKPKVR